MRRIRMGLVPGLLLVLALTVGACGGGDKNSGVASLGGGKTTTTATSPGGGGGRMQRALAFARCMRQHGINVPDPQLSGNDITQQLPRGLDPDDPRLRAAQQACQQYGSLPPINGR